MISLGRRCAALLCVAAAPIYLRAETPAEYVQSGFEHYYNLEYDQAVGDFEKAIQLDSAAPEPHDHLAQALLYREMFRNGALESEMVSGNNSFLRRPKMNPSSEVEKKFDSEIRKATELAQARIARNPKDTGAWHALGVAYGLRSNYNFLVRKAWRDALTDATNARKMDEKVTAIDPSNLDARLVEGVHDYVIGSLPWTWRTLGAIAGFHGDKARGIQTLEEVARRGKSNRTDAKILLCALYRREGEPKKALPLLDELLRRYPRDYLLRFEQAQMYGAIGDKTHALAAIGQIEELKKAGAPGYTAIPWDKIYYQEGNIEFWYNDLEHALVHMKKVTASPAELDLNTGVLAFMRQGQIYDMTNRHNLAIDAYKRAIAFAPEADAARESRRYISSPYRREKS